MALGEGKGGKSVCLGSELFLAREIAGEKVLEDSSMRGEGHLEGAGATRTRGVRELRGTQLMQENERKKKKATTRRTKHNNKAEDEREGMGVGLVKGQTWDPDFKY